VDRFSSIPDPAKEPAVALITVPPLEVFEMVDKKTTRQDFINALLDLETASKENLALLVKLLEKSISAGDAQNAKVITATKAILKEIVTEDIIYGKSKTNPAIAAKITKQLDHTLEALNKLNNTRKQLLADADKVKLSQTMLTGEKLPKAKAEIYNKSLSKILKKVTVMAELHDNLKLEMHHGKNFSNMSPEELSASRRGIATNLDKLNEVNRTMKEKMKKGPAQEEAPKPEDHQTPTPFNRTLKRGRGN
jgi:hypothetical protein